MSQVSAIEQGSPRAYVRTLFFFSLSDGYEKDETMRLLREGLEATAKAIPLLTAKQVPDAAASQKCRLAISLGDSVHFYEADYRRPTTFHWTYETLKKNGFPTSALPGELLFPFSMFPDPNAAPIFGAQANFIQGGLILGVCASHTKADARAIYEILRVWAQNCRAIQDKSSSMVLNLKPELFDNESLRRGFTDGRKVTDHHEWTISDKPIMPLGLLREGYRTRVYHLSPEKLARLKADSSSTDKGWVSTNDAVTALIWACTIAPQLEAIPASERPKDSFCSVCVDARLRCCPKLSPNHIGCPMISATPRASAESILTRDLKTLAPMIRNSITAVGPEYVDNLVSLLNTTPDLSCLMPTAFTCMMENGLMISAWQKVPFYDINWGPALGGFLDSIRCATTGWFNGVHIILPRPKDDGLEVIIGLHESLWEELEKDQTWTTYAEQVVGGY